MAQPSVSQTRTLFALVCRVEFNIRSSAEVIWTLLADAPGYPGWNSTVTAIDGRIREGERIRIHVPGAERTFSPKVSAVVPGRHMVWTGGFLPLFLGVRTFTLRPQSDRSTIFIMIDGAVAASSCKTVRWRSTASLNRKPVSSSARTSLPHSMLMHK